MAMSEQHWDQRGIFEPPHVRHEAEQQIKIERPPDADVSRQTPPPAEDQARAELRAVQDDPRLAEELWRQVDAGQRPDEATTVAGLATALYLLQSLHAPDKPGYEHLPREEGDEPPPDGGDDRDA
jgi:hypothetical protein